MSEQKKQERDFTPEVDALLPETASLAKVGILVVGGDPRSDRYV